MAASLVPDVVPMDIRCPPSSLYRLPRARAIDVGHSVGPEPGVLRARDLSDGVLRARGLSLGARDVSDGVLRARETRDGSCRHGLMGRPISGCRVPAG